MQIGTREVAERMLREFGPVADAECEARASYYEMQGDKAVAEGWRRTREIVAHLRQSRAS